MSPLSQLAAAVSTVTTFSMWQECDNTVKNHEYKLTHYILIMYQTAGVATPSSVNSLHSTVVSRLTRYAATPIYKSFTKNETSK